MSHQYLKSATSARVVPALAIQGGGNRINLGYPELDVHTSGLHIDEYGRPVNAANTLKIANPNSSAAGSQPYNADRLMGIEVDKRPVLTNLDTGLNSYDPRGLGRHAFPSHIYSDSSPNTQFYHHSASSSDVAGGSCCCGSEGDFTPLPDTRLSQVPHSYTYPNIF